MPTLHDPDLRDVPAIVVRGVNDSILSSAPFELRSVKEIRFLMADEAESSAFTGAWRAIEYRSPRRSTFVRTFTASYQALDGRMITAKRTGYTGHDQNWIDWYAFDAGDLAGLTDQDIYDALGICDFDAGPGNHYAKPAAILHKGTRVIVYQACGRHV